VSAEYRYEPVGISSDIVSTRDYGQRNEKFKFEKRYFQRDFHWSSHSIGEMISIAFEEKKP
jgi:hypothetical protein